MSAKKPRSEEDEPVDPSMNVGQCWEITTRAEKEPSYQSDDTYVVARDIVEAAKIAAHATPKDRKIISLRWMGPNVGIARRES